MTTSPLIFLVHGTIPSIGPIGVFKEVKWIGKHSAFQKSLSEILPNSLCEAFMWSGKNSHLEREAAGRNLAALITARAEQLPGPPILIIAHSHGGNVTLSALRLLSHEVQTRVAGVVTLGTPFIWFREHWSETSKQDVIRGLRNAAIGWTLACGAVIPLLFARFHWSELLPLLLAAILWGMLAWLQRAARVNWNAAARKLVARFQPTLEPGTKLLAVTTNVDEAGWWLRALLLPTRVFDSLSFMSFRSFERNAPTPGELERIMFFFGPGLIGALITGVILWMLEPVFRFIRWLFGCWMTGIVGVAQFGLGLIGRLFGRSAPWGFGESSIMPWLVDVWTETLPVGATSSQLLHSRALTMLNLQRHDTGQTELVRFIPKRICSPHSWLHDNQSVINFVCKWASGQCGTESQPAGAGRS